jgi:hypothetical protein
VRPLREEDNDILVLRLLSLVAARICHFTPEVCQTQERETEVRVRGRQGGALAVSRFLSAKAAGISLAGRSVQVAGRGHRGSQENFDGRALPCGS